MQFILEHISDIFAFGCISAIAIEKNSNIKFKPLTWLGNQVNSDMKKEIETTNKKIDDIQDQINDIKYKNAMKDLADVRNRLISYGLLMQKGEKLDCDVLKNIQHDLDVYDYYKETYKYMDLNGRKVKINGEVETTRALVNERIKKCNFKGDAI